MDISIPSETNMHPWRFTVQAYRQIADMGLFGHETRVELINGEVFRVACQGPAHILTISRLLKISFTQCGDEAVVIGRSPVMLDDYSEPEADMAILRGEHRDFENRLAHPADILLAAEVAVSSLSFDRNKKLPRYAETGVSEVWIVDVKRRVVEQYREPCEGEYQHCAYIALGERIQASQFPAIDFTTDRLFSNAAKK